MKRVLVGALLGALSFSAVGSFSLDVVHAAPKKKAAKAAKAAAIPQSAEIAKTMGDLKWGTSRDEVFQHFSNAIKDKYKPLLAKAGGALEEDKLRAKMKDELAKLKSSEVDFNGKKTGWDVSFLKGEFTHKNAESLMVVSDTSSENYYFFIQNKLWKWYKAFKTEAFAGKSFDQFADAIQERFGPSQKREGEATHGGGKQNWLEWQDPTTRLRAIDNSHFYGFYCLVFEDKDTLRKLPQLRTNKVAEGGKGNSLVDSVTSDEANNSASDSNPDVMDRITGKMRHRQEAAPGSVPAKKGESTTPSSTTPPPAPSGGGVSKDDDPLKGLGL
ncbi:MAG: hypothetical protein JWN48_4441 [Myxococcaceae bacterium]|nr:hypothetical protein [Myxococcaceae bacterium]